MRRQLLSVLLLSCLFLSTAIGQNALPIGKWRAHLPYRIGQYVTQSKDQVFYSTGLSIITLDKEELSTQFISKVNGLSNAGINLIKYNLFSDILIVVYSNSVFDLVKPDEVITMNQIKNFENISGDKSVNNIFIDNESDIYLATSYGLSKVNILANEFAFTTFTGVPVQDVIIFNNRLWIATEEGVYSTPISNPIPDDFSNWDFLDEEDGFPADYSANVFSIFNDELYLGINNGVYRFINNGLEFVYEDEDPVKTLKYLSAEGPHLLIGFEKCPASGCSFGKMVYLNANGTLGFPSRSCMGVPNNAIEDEQGRIWFGDDWRNFRMMNSLDDQNCTTLSFNSPYSEENKEIFIQDNQVWIAAGGLTAAFGNRFLAHGFSSFIDGQWTIFTRDNVEVLKGQNQNDPADDLRDFLSITVHPENGKVYAGSFLEGLIEIDGDNFVVYNEQNSTLQDATGDNGRVRVGGLAYDENNNLWMSNHAASGGRPISVLKEDGTWQSFNAACGQSSLHQLGIDGNGFKWFALSSGQAGVLAFDEGDIDDPTDDRCRTFTTGNSDLPSNDVNSLAVDLDGDVWVGTTKGVLIFDCRGNTFESDCRGTKRIVEVDGFGAFLLETEEIQTIAVDGANRKWIGTKNGLFLLSPSGEEEIERFTVDNSPLFDNNIVDIAINDKTGEVFIGTSKGIISYQSDAVSGRAINNAKVEVFPNPVRGTYDGPITIRGLARDANVKITDVNGKLVFETQALGGQAIWNGRDYNGRRANSGVYLIFSTSDPSNSGFNASADTAVGKLLLIN